MLFSVDHKTYVHTLGVKGHVYIQFSIRLLLLLECLMLPNKMMSVHTDLLMYIGGRWSSAC